MDDGPLEKRWIVDRHGDIDGKHTKCRKFVLDLDHDPHALPALLAYAAACSETHPVLAAELVDLAADAADSQGVVGRDLALTVCAAPELVGGLCVEGILRESKRNADALP